MVALSDDETELLAHHAHNAEDRIRRVADALGEAERAAKSLPRSNVLIFDPILGAIERYRIARACMQLAETTDEEAETLHREAMAPFSGDEPPVVLSSKGAAEALRLVLSWKDVDRSTPTSCACDRLPRREGMIMAQKHQTCTKAEAAAKVDQLLVELRDALAACGLGPLRAIVDSDGNCVVHQPSGRPMSKTQRVWGVPVQMLRDVYGPFMPPRDIIVDSVPSIKALHRQEGSR